MLSVARPVHRSGPVHVVELLVDQSDILSDLVVTGECRPRAAEAAPAAQAPPITRKSSSEQGAQPSTNAVLGSFAPTMPGSDVGAADRGNLIIRASYAAGSDVTLIVLALLPNAMVVVSDQRLTDVQTGQPTTDRANKAIVDLRSGTAFAYTGVAQIGRTPTDEWLLSALAAGSTPTEGLEELRDRATRAFATLPHPASVKRLAVVGAGWATFATGTGEIEPFLVRVSNFDGGDRWLPVAQDNFTVRWFHPLRAAAVSPSASDAVIGVWTAGQDLPPSRLAAMTRLLVRALKRTGSIADGARVIAEEVRSFANRNRSVGRGLLIVTMPKPRPDIRGGISSPVPPVSPKSLADYFRGKVANDGATFLYIPPDLFGPAAAYAPLVVDQGVQFKGGEVWSEEPPWWNRDNS